MNHGVGPLVGLLLLSSLAPSRGCAQLTSRRFVVDHWTTDAGLPQNTVNAIVQARDGYLWLGTNGGLVRFDGLTFSVRADSGLHSDRITTLAEDAGGALWVGTEAGFSRHTRGTFRTWRHADGLTDEMITGIGISPDGSTWAGTATGQLVQMRGDRVASVIYDSAGNSRITGLAIDGTGAVWLAAAAAWRIDPITRASARARLGNDDIRSVLLPDRDGFVWVVTAHTFGQVRGNDRAIYPLTAFGGGGPVAVLRARDGALWVGDHRGAIWRAPGGYSIAPLFALIKPVGGGTLLALAEDREGNVWAGSATNGLYRVRPALFQVYTQADGLAHDITAAVFADHLGRVWAGANCGGVSVIERGRVTVLGSREGLRHLCAWSLAEDSTHAMWIGTYGGGMGRFRDGRMTWYSTADGLPSNSVLALLRDTSDAMWIGTEAGLALWDRGARRSFAGGDAFTGVAVRALYQTRNGDLWVGTPAGVSRVSHGQVTTFNTTNGLPRDYVRAIHEDADGTIWLGTYGGGLSRYRSGRLKTISVDDGLFDNVVSSIADDGLGSLWMSSNRGISRVSLRELNAVADGQIARAHSVVYGAADGMLSSETNGGFTPAVAHTREGLWYPTVRGLVVIDPAVALANPVAPIVAVERVTVGGRPAGVGPDIRVGPGGSDIEISYSSLNYSDPKSVAFRYMLLGWDASWVEAGTRRSAYYSRLTPARYEFAVSAANRDGIWSVPTTIVRLDVRPHVWETGWFRLVAGALVVLGLAGAVQLRLRRLHAAHAAQRAFSQQLIAREEHERKRIASELHDGLGQDLLVLKNRAQLGARSTDAASAREQLAEITGIAAGAIQNVRRMAQNLRPYQIDQLGLTAAVRSSIDAMSKATGLSVASEIGDVDGRLSPEAEINLFRILQEAMNNVVKHADATSVSIALRANGGAVELSVADDGKGFTPGGKRRGGLGLSSMNERAELAGGRCEIRSAPDGGTRLTLTIPATAHV